MADILEDIPDAVKCRPLQNASFNYLCSMIILVGLLKSIRHFGDNLFAVISFFFFSSFFLSLGACFVCFMTSVLQTIIDIGTGCFQNI